MITKHRHSKAIIFATLLCLLWLNVKPQAMVKDIYPGVNGSQVTSLTNVNGTLFFTATNNGLNKVQIWKSDGTEGGTVLVKDIRPTGWPREPLALTNVNGTLFFVAEEQASGAELWKTDGTASGTVLVKDIWPGTSGSSPGGLTAVNGIVYFFANDSIHGMELWKSDGTPTGTVLVKDIRPGTGTSHYPNKDLIAFQNKLYFVASDGTSGEELWTSDGTESGTSMFLEINSGPSSSYPQGFIPIGSTMYFAATTSANGTELWKTDGTVSGTQMIKDIYSGVGSSNALFSSYGIGAYLSNGTLFFSAKDATNGMELWKTDGTESGTVMVKNINTAAVSGTTGHSNPMSMVIVGSNLVFTAMDETTGMELWVSDGTEGGTVKLKDFTTATGGGYPSGTIIYNGLAYFNAKDDVNGIEFWKTDGTPSGTVLVKDIYSGSSSSNAGGFVISNSVLFFIASSSSYGAELWRYPAGMSSNVEDIKNSTFFKIYPNPTMGLFEIENSFPEKADIKVYTIQGELVENFELDKESSRQLNYTALPTGVYLFQIQTGFATINQRVVISSKL